MGTNFKGALRIQSVRSSEDTRDWLIYGNAADDGRPVVLAACFTVGDDGQEGGAAHSHALLFKAAPELRAALLALTEWGCAHTSPRDANSPHNLLIAARDALALADGAEDPARPVTPAPEVETRRRVIVEVEGGVVQAVYATDARIDVQVVDHDNADAGDEDADEAVEALDRERSQLAQVF